MPISALPTPPSRSDSPQDFSDRADALLGALPGFVTEANALQSDVNAKEASASSYATIATDKAAEAQGHATTSSTKASEAAASAVAAAAAASNAEIAFDSFDDKYLGSKASDPATDNDGNPLLTGALYWNTTVGAVRVWNGSAWLSMAADASIVDFQQAGAGAVVRTAQDKMREWVSVKDFGAVGGGVTDDTAAFNSAIAYANSRGGVDYLNVVGTTIFIPDGRYKVGSLNPITRSGCEFVGASRSGAVLLCTPGVTTFTFGDGANIVVGGGIKNCKVEYLTTPTAGTVFAAFDYAYRIAITDLLVANIGTLCRLGETSARPSGGITVDRVDGSKANVAIPLFDVRFGAGLFLNQVRVFVPVGAPVHPEPMTTVNGCSVFNCSSGFWDTLQGTNCLFERFDIGLGVSAASGMVYQNFFFSNTIMDYFRRWCVYAESQAGGVISGIRFDASSWFASWETDAISLLGSGYHDNHHFSGKVVIAGAAGVSYGLTGARNIVFDSMQLNSCNRLGTAGGAMAFAAGAKGFSVLGCKGNVDTAAVGFAWRAPYGISVGADADRYVVANCAFEGSTGGYAFSANSSGSSYRKAANNLNANYAGHSAIALPSSGVRYTNTSPFVEEWSFFGGTITGGYDKNLQGFPGTLPYVHFRLQPGDTFAVGYSVAPATKTFIEP